MRSRITLSAVLVVLGACTSAPQAPPRHAAAPAPAAHVHDGGGDGMRNGATVRGLAWGPERDGLRARAAAPRTAARGDWIEVDVDVAVDPSGLPDGVRTADARGAWYFARLRLTSATGGEDVVIRCVDPSAGMPDPPQPPDVPGPRSVDGYLLRELTAEGGVLDGRVTFPLASAWDVVTVGSYRGVVELAVDETAYSHEARGDWRGVLRSAPFELTVSPAPVVIQELEVPSEMVGGDPGQTVALQLRVRNGFAIGLRGESVSAGGAPGAEFADTVREFVTPGSGGWTIFETSYAPEHLWHPAPGRDFYRVLWRGESHVKE